MTRRRLFLIASLPLAVCVVTLMLGVLAMLPARKGVTRANFDRIEIGMTLAEVEVVFGKKNDPHKGNLQGDNPENRRWDCDEGHVIILFSQERVAGKGWWKRIPVREDVLEIMDRWIHLRPAPKSITFEQVP
jgi:hypothetical protein